jgi:hypothetical protein
VALREAVVKANGPYWARQVEIQHKIASGWVADAEGKATDALAFMQAAAELESKGDTHDTLSPGPIGTTAHEALGEVLLKVGKPADALAQFEESLRISKHRARGYYGAAKAASLTGNDNQFKTHVAKLAELCAVPSASIPANLDVNDPQLTGLPCAWIARQ